MAYEYTQGKGSLLLCPGSNGDWAKALHVAKSKKLLREDFPDLSRHPLSKIAAIQIQASASRRRQGLRKITEHVGSVRAITATELEFLDAVNATPETRPENEDGLELWLTAGSGIADMGTLCSGIADVRLTSGTLCSGDADVGLTSCTGG